YRWEIRARRSLAPPVHGTQARTDPPCLLSSLPQSRGDWQPRGANRREKSAQQTDGRRPQNGVEEEFWRDGEGECDLAPGLKVHRGGAITVKRQISSQSADNSARQRQRQ